MGEKDAPVAPGEVVAGKYRVERVLGTGGMGVVFAATQLGLDRPVAMKFLLPAAAKDPDVVVRFSREAKAVAKIHSEHVVRVLDTGVLPAGVPFMVMEYLEGGDLAQRLANERRIPLPEIAGYLLEACEALAEAHAAGIVHRDLKPANLFLARRPDHTTRVKLLDFGISKAPVGSAGGITSTQAIMGSPVYMSPEQLVSSKSVDARSDVWSLGVVLYEALAGAPPFTADSMPQIVTRILHTAPARLSEARPDLPPQVQVIVDRCLEKEPVARYADVAELAAALAPFAVDGARAVERIARVLGRPGIVPATYSSAPPPPLPAPPPPAFQPLPPPMMMLPSARPTDAWGGTQARIPKRSSAPWIILGLLGGCSALGVGGAVALRHAAVKALEPLRTPASIVAPPSSETPPPDLAPITLVPPPEPTMSSTPAVSAATRVEPPPKAKPTPWRGKPAPAPAPQPAPAPAPEAAPTDPLHMGIK
jgi:serine/threonine-protein kinase